MAAGMALRALLKEFSGQPEQQIASESILGGDTWQLRQRRSLNLPVQAHSRRSSPAGRSQLAEEARLFLPVNPPSSAIRLLLLLLKIRLATAGSAEPPDRLTGAASGSRCPLLRP